MGEFLSIIGSHYPIIWIQSKEYKIKYTKEKKYWFVLSDTSYIIRAASKLGRVSYVERTTSNMRPLGCA